MVYTEQQTLSKIEAHIKRRGGVFKAWFVGTAERAGAQLKHHGVKRKGNCWIYVHAGSSEIARKVQGHLVTDFGMVGMGGQNSHSQSGDYVYAYKRTSTTKP